MSNVFFGSRFLTRWNLCSIYIFFNLRWRKMWRQPWLSCMKKTRLTMIDGEFWKFQFRQTLISFQELGCSFFYFRSWQQVIVGLFMHSMNICRGYFDEEEFVYMLGKCFSWLSAEYSFESNATNQACRKLELDSFEDL